MIKLKQLLMEIKFKKFKDLFDTMPPQLKKRVYDLKKIKQNPDHIIHVALDGNKIIGSTTLLIEQKFIHNGGRVGHIEDVVVRKDYEGRRIGMKLVMSLLNCAKEKNCYKTILDCKDDVKEFYEKIGFKHESNGMRFDHQVP